MRLILASASERRRELLSWLGVPFEVEVSDFDERSVGEGDPARLVPRLALGKARMVGEKLSGPSTVWNHTGSRRAQAFGSEVFDRETQTELAQARRGDKRDLTSLSRLSRMDGSGWLVIGADTVVQIDDEVIGKPGGEKDAVRILEKLSGKTHWVYTGVAVIDVLSGEEVVGVEKSGVTFRALSRKEIRAYVASGEPLDKAGAYAIQMGAKGFVKKVQGSFTNVVGLPLVLLGRLLRKQGFVLKADVSKIVFEKTGYNS